MAELVKTEVMAINLDRAADFVQMNARMLDRRRFSLLLGEAEPTAVVTALDAYRNSDGGYGWGLEPDLRAGESQPGGALHAFEVFEEIAPHTSGQAEALCDWLSSVSLPDGGIPFALPVSRTAGCAPFWAEADATTSSLHITAAVAGAAHRVARTDPTVAKHPWLARASKYCMEAIEKMDQPSHALELQYALQFLDAAHDILPDAPAQLMRLGSLLPSDGRLHVGGGKEDEFVGPLDFAPTPDRPIRQLFRPDVVDAELARLVAEQQPDGGWPLGWQSYSPAAAVEWRGYLTVRAVSVLRRANV